MKKLTKLIFSCAAVAAVTAAVGTAAMAESVDLVGDIHGTYDTETGAVTLTDDSYDVGGQQTILIFKGEITDTVTDENIEYINQEEAITKGIAGLKNGAGAKETKYVIRIGGDKDGTIGSKGFLESTFEVPGDNPPPTGIKIMYGDATLDYKVGEKESADECIAVSDAMMVLQHTAGKTTLTGAAFAAAAGSDGASAGDKPVGTTDAMCILSFKASKKAPGSVGTIGTYNEQ